MLTSEEVLGITVAVVLAIAVVGLMFLVMRRLRQRKAQLLHELKDSPRLVSDRAFNRLAMARQESTILERQGIDLGSVRETLAQAQAALDQRQFDRAYELAQSAHEAMVGLRLRSTPIRGGAPGPSAPPPAPPVGATAPAPNPPAPVPVPIPSSEPARIPKNRAESQFQLHLLEDELAKARRDPSRASLATDATPTYDRARSAFDRGDFTESFRLALRGRRQVGGGVESLGPNPATGAPSAPASDEEFSGPVDPLQTAERVAGAARCPHCGYPASTDDTFCRGCGAARAPAACPKCGAARTPADTFCGRCGTRFAPVS